jgi:hypothetical protein
MRINQDKHTQPGCSAQEERHGQYKAYDATDRP